MRIRDLIELLTRAAGDASGAMSEELVDAAETLRMACDTARPAIAEAARAGTPAPDAIYLDHAVRLGVEATIEAHATVIGMRHNPRHR